MRLFKNSVRFSDLTPITENQMENHGDDMSLSLNSSKGVTCRGLYWIPIMGLIKGQELRLWHIWKLSYAGWLTRD